MSPPELARQRFWPGPHRAVNAVCDAKILETKMRRSNASRFIGTSAPLPALFIPEARHVHSVLGIIRVLRFDEWSKA